MLSSDYPILEFDENKEALIRPEFLKTDMSPSLRGFSSAFFMKPLKSFWSERRLPCTLCSEGRIL